MDSDERLRLQAMADETLSTLLLDAQKRNAAAVGRATAAELSKALTLTRVVLQHIYFHSSKHCEDCVCSRHIAMRAEEILVKSGIGAL